MESTTRVRHRHSSLRRLLKELERILEELIALRLADRCQAEGIPDGEPKVLSRTTVRGRPVVVVLLPGTTLPPLTKRQEEVLRLLGYEHGNSGIARILGIGEDTVKFHLRRISTRWGVTSRAALARRAALLYG